MTSCTECECVVITGTRSRAIAIRRRERCFSCYHIALSNCKILIPCDKQYFCRKNPHTLANALKSMENTSLEKSLDTFAGTCHSFLELSSH